MFFTAPKKTILAIALLISCSLTGAKDLATKSTQATDVVSFIATHNIKFINLEFSSLTGTPHSYTITADIAPDAFEKGVIFDGSSIAGYSDINNSDLMCKPDIATLQLLPWTTDSYAVARVSCNIAHSDGSAYAGCSRTLLQTACKQLAAEHGYTFMVSPEIEFFLFPEKAIAKDNSTINTTLLDSNGYCSHATNDTCFLLKQEILSTLNQMGMRPEKFHHEVAPSQHEITLRCCDALKMADQLLVAKNVITYLAKKHGHRAVFMPKPVFGENGSAMHLNFSLSNALTKENLFHDKHGAHSLSTIALQFIAGVLSVARESAAFFNPTVNSYKRLVKGYEAPIFCAWGARNRTALIRIPQATGSSSVRAELRSGDLMANPYITFYLLLAAGMDGVKNNYRIAPEATTNLYHMTDEQRIAAGIEQLPSTLDEALTTLSASEKMRTILGTTIVDSFLQEKQVELDSFKTAVTNWELQRYLND